VSTQEASNSNRRSNALSTIFAIVAVAFGIAAVVLFIRGSGGTAPIPTPAPGANEVINVIEALKAEGLRVEQPPRLFISRGKLPVPGQGVTVDGTPGFIFLFPDADAARAAVDGVDPDTLVPERLAGTPAPEGERRLTQNSNIVMLLVDGSDETWQKVQAAVASLP
jgi:hypothetical protein